MIDEILKLVEEGESATVEFKKSTASLREGIETICAFANHSGGYLLFGIDDLKWYSPQSGRYIKLRSDFIMGVKK